MAFKAKFKNENKVVANTDIYPQLKGETFICFGDSFMDDGVEKVCFEGGRIENIMFKAIDGNNPLRSFKVEHFILADAPPTKDQLKSARPMEKGEHIPKFKKGDWIERIHPLKCYEWLGKGPFCAARDSEYIKVTGREVVYIDGHEKNLHVKNFKKVFAPMFKKDEKIRQKDSGEIYSCACDSWMGEEGKELVRVKEVDASHYDLYCGGFEKVSPFFRKGEKVMYGDKETFCKADSFIDKDHGEMVEVESCLVARPIAHVDKIECEDERIERELAEKDHVCKEDLELLGSNTPTEGTEEPIGMSCTIELKLTPDMIKNAKKLDAFCDEIEELSANQSKMVMQFFDPSIEPLNIHSTMKELIPLEWNNGRANDELLNVLFKIEPEIQVAQTVYVMKVYKAYKANAKDESISTPDGEPFESYDAAIQAVEAYRNKTIQKYFKL